MRRRDETGFSIFNRGLCRVRFLFNGVRIHVPARFGFNPRLASTLDKGPYSMTSRKFLCYADFTQKPPTVSPLLSGNSLPVSSQVSKSPCDLSAPGENRVVV
jgi:hypothetical protein